MMTEMDGLAGSGLRWTRAAFLAAVALCLGVLAHLSARGILPSPRALAVLLVLTTVAAAWLLARPASTRRVVLMLVVGQTCIHGALTALAGHRGDPVVARPAARPSYQPMPSDQRLIVPSGAGRRTGSFFDQVSARPPSGGDVQLVAPAWVQHIVADMSGAHAAMALAHLVAAALVGLWLAAGERALWSLLRLAAQLTVRLLELLATATTPPATTAGRGRPWTCTTHVASPAALRVLCGTVARRGPPRVVAA
jgi:hypothetical protein